MLKIGTDSFFFKSLDYKRSQSSAEKLRKVLILTHLNQCNRGLYTLYVTVNDMIMDLLVHAEI